MAQSNNLTPQSVVNNINNQSSNINGNNVILQASNPSPGFDWSQSAASPTAYRKEPNSALNTQSPLKKQQQPSQPSPLPNASSVGRGIRHSATMNVHQQSAQQQQHLQSVLPEMALVSQAQQRHQMDQEFAAAATGSITPVATINNSVQQANGNNMNSIGKLQQQYQQKRSALDEHPAGSKFRLQSLGSGGSGIHAPTGTSTTNSASIQNANGVFSTQMAEQQQAQFSRCFKGTGNQIAAIVGQPFNGANTANGIGGGQSTLSQLAQQKVGAHQQQQMVNFRDRIAATRTNATAMTSSGANAAAQYSAKSHHKNNLDGSGEEFAQQLTNAELLSSSNRKMVALNHPGGSSSHLAHHHAHPLPNTNSLRATQQYQQYHQQQQQDDFIVSSAGRKTRIKSGGRQRRFSTSSIHGGKNEDYVPKHGSAVEDAAVGYDQLETNRGGAKNALGQNNPKGLGPQPHPMSQAAAQIIQQQQKTIGSATSANQQQQIISSAETYQSDGQLKIQNTMSQGVRSGAAAYYQSNNMADPASSSEVTGVMDRFNSRAQKKALNSVQTVSSSNKEKLYTNLQHIVDTGQSALKKSTHEHHHQQYGTHGSYNSTTSATNVHKQGSHSVTRRNHPALQETASGHCLDSAGSQHSHRSNGGTANAQAAAAAKEGGSKNHNSLRNSKSLNKKLSQTGNGKKVKKLKKSESQARHQQITKSEMMTQQMRAQDNDIELTSQGQQKNSFPSGLNSANGTSSAMHRATQQEPHVKRVSNRTPQSFTVNNDKVTGGVTSAGNKGNNASAKHTEVVKGSTTSNAGNASSNQANANFNKNITDLHKNAMHIKKLNFQAGGRQMQSNATQPVIAHPQSSNAANSHYTAGGPQQVQEKQLQQLHMAIQNNNHTSKESSFSTMQKQLSSSASKTVQNNNNTNSDRPQYFSAPNQAATSTIESLLRNAAATGQNSFQDFKNAFTQKNNQFPSGSASSSNQVTQKTYKLMKSAERGENNTNNMLTQQTIPCRLHSENPSHVATSSSPCTCKRQQNSGGGFQSKASQNFQKSFRHGNFVYHGSHRRSNDFSTIQAKQTSSAQSSPFTANLAQTPSFNQAAIGGADGSKQQPTPHITQSKREDVNKFGGNFGSQTQQQQQQRSSELQNQAAKGPNNITGSLNPLMKDLLQYLQQAYQSQNSTEGQGASTANNTMNSSQNMPLQNLTQQQAPVDQLKQRLAQAQMRQAAQQQMNQANEATAAAGGKQAAHPFSSASDAQKNKLIHFEKGDRIIYEPNEMHQLKYINDKGEVSPITGVQYILTQPNFSKGRPCHFFVVNKQEFEAATKGFKLKQEEQKAEELAKQRKMQAVANIRSHRASQKIRTQNANGKGKKTGAERRQSAKGGREASGAAGSKAEAAAKAKEEEKKDEKDKYHNQAYNYQKLRSLKWMGGPYRNPHDEPAPIWRPSAEEQELKNQLEAKREIKAKYNLLSLNKQAGSELYKYILMLGNNHDVVKRVMDNRPSWTQIKSSQTLYNFKWAPSSRQIKFDFLGKHGQKNLVNHFENHALITTKDQLIESMSKLCENLHQDIFNSIPITFVIDLGTPLCQHEFDKFTYYFNMVEKFKDQYLDAEDESAKEEVLGQMNTNIVKHYQLSEKKRKSTTVTMRSTLYNGHNMWLFKPADANRGRGVNLFNTIDQLKRLILEHTSRAETKQFQNFAQTNNLHGNGGPGINNNAQVENSHQDGAAAASNPANMNQATGNANEQQPAMNTANVKSDVFVLQKYIERPLLISERKFDIRLWVLVTPEHKCYYFKEGYIRMSGQKYDLNQVDNLFVHLTNNAIQKHGQNYGEFEEGNILSFKEGAEYLKQQDNLEVDFYRLLKDDILPIIETTMMSVRQKINKNNRKFCLEIFGYDFMVDSELRPWLIEVNTNPCLEESNQLLRYLIPRMLDDAFKLTLDVMFPPKTAAQIAEAQAVMQEDPEHPMPSGKQETFSVPGTPDNENLWGDQPFYILRVPGAVVVQGS